MRIRLSAAAVAILLLGSTTAAAQNSVPADDSPPLHPDSAYVMRLSNLAAVAIENAHWEEAEALLSFAHRYAEGERRSRIAFFWAYTLYKQGEAIRDANTEDDPIESLRALSFFQEAVRLVQQSSDPNVVRLAESAARYIREQEPVLLQALFR